MSKIVTGLALAIPLVFYLTVMIVMEINFGRKCEGYLKQAADANTVELAKTPLKKAIDYLKTEGIFVDTRETHYTSIIYNTPDEDVGYWCSNLTAALEEINNADEDADALTTSNLLMKLRETLTDDKESGVSVTVPPGIARYPNNTAFCLWGTLSVILGAIGVGLIWVEIG